MDAAALICPGQGAQRAGGLEDLPASAQEVFELGSAVVGVDLWRLGLDKSADAESELRRPSRLQPYLVCWAVAEWRAALDAERAPVAPDFVTGHSSGLNSALVLSGAVALEDGLRFAHACGLEMDRACDDGAGGLVALVGASRAQAEAVAARSGAALANHNADDQTVLGGYDDALAAVQAAHEGVEPPPVPLRVAGAFHTEAFAESDRRSERWIAELPIAEHFTPLIGNCEGQLIETPAQLTAELRGQYSRPVEWLRVLETLDRLGVRRYLTLGPGNAMAGLVRRFGRTRPAKVRIVRVAQQLQRAADAT